MAVPQELIDVLRASGLIANGSRGVVMVSGGADSACLAAGLAAMIGPGNLDAVHLNYRLRPESDEDESACRDLCGRLLIDLRVERPSLPEGNTQAAARDARYEAAERLRARWGADWIATGHTRTDLAETMIYRLASSPGRRALLGLAPRRGRIVRPLLALGRQRLRELADASGLPYRDDPSNQDPRYARNRIRSEVLPVLREISAEAERNFAATWREVAQESDALESLAASAVPGPEKNRAPVAALADLHPAVRRIALRRMAESVGGPGVPVGMGRAEEIWRVAMRPEGGDVELGGGLRAVCESGWIVVARSGRQAGAPSREQQGDSWPPAILPLPGACRWGGWEISAELREGRPARPEGPDVAMLDAAALGSDLVVRGWQEGDRIEPLGMGGSKSLQDLFTDRGVARSHRPLLPVLVAGGRIAWVAGVATAEPFKIHAGTLATAVVTAIPVSREGGGA